MKNEIESLKEKKPEVEIKIVEKVIKVPEIVVETKIEKVEKIVEKIVKVAEPVIDTKNEDELRGRLHEEKNKNKILILERNEIENELRPEL